jgi:hypothetical protein
LGHQRLSLSHHYCRSINDRNRRGDIAVPDAEIKWTNFRKMTLRRRQGKSPLAIESIDNRYRRSPRGVTQ